MKFCKDCVHYIPPVRYGWWHKLWYAWAEFGRPVKEDAKCGETRFVRPEVVNVVNGNVSRPREIVFQDCTLARSERGLCGEEGKNFKRNDEQRR